MEAKRRHFNDKKTLRNSENPEHIDGDDNHDDTSVGPDCSTSQRSNSSTQENTSEEAKKTGNVVNNGSNHVS